MTPEGRCFTFVWRLENASYCIQKKGDVIRSPAFVVKDVEDTQWRLLLYPRGCSKRARNIGYRLYREKDNSARNKVEIKFELTFIGIDGSNLTHNSVCKGIFPKGAAPFGHGIIPIEDVFVTRKSVFLPNDTLTLRCKMWKGEGEMTEDVKCTALTRIFVEKRTVKWQLKNFSLLEKEHKLNLTVKTVQDNSSLMSVDLSLVEGINSEGIINFELSPRDETIKFATVGLFLMNDSGIRVDCNQEEIWFDPPASKQLTFTFTKNHILERKDVYLPNDTLSLIWEWRFSRGIVSEEPEEDEHGCIRSEIFISDARTSSVNQIALFKHFVDNLKLMYEEQSLSDIKLKTATREFPAHKFVLSASSPVFKAMFSCDMKENITNCVQIEDLDDDTVNRMLLFLYTTRVGELTGKTAMNLYEAADKYDIIVLRKICSSFLLQNLSPKRACNVLLFADAYADAELKSKVQDYIMENSKKIKKSAEWKALIEANPKLAAETVCKRFK